MSNIDPIRLFWVGLLCKITKAKVIMSSSWRFGWNEDGSVKKNHLNDIDTLFKKFGVNISGKTCQKAMLNKQYEMDLDTLSYFIKSNNDMFIPKKTEEDLVPYFRGSQILNWVETNNFNGRYIILEDDITDVIVYKELQKHVIRTRFYGHFYGFRFIHFIKSLWVIFRDRN